MYSFAQRPDTQVVDEPLYGYYLSSAEVNHPGREELLNSLETDPEVITKFLIGGDPNKEILFFKNMAHHLVGLDLQFLNNFTNIILLREPADVINSLSKTLDVVGLRDTGFEFQYRIFEFLNRSGITPIVLDSRDLLKNPGKVLQDLCRLLDIPFYESMLEWKQGGIPEDGSWAKYWYQNVHKSTGFNAYRESNEKLPSHLKDLYEECKSYYDLLTEKKIISYNEKTKYSESP
jgi:hypothetical protein